MTKFTNDVIFLATFMIVNAVCKIAVYRDYFIPGHSCPIPKMAILAFFNNESLKLIFIEKENY